MKKILQKNFIKQGRKTLAFMLVVILCTAQMKPVEAKENESTNLTILVEGMVHDGILKESQISSVAVVEANMNGNGVARSATEKLEVIKIVSEDENTCTETYVVPFLMGDDGLTTLSLSGTATQKNLDYNDVIYVLSTATYIFYSAAETDYEGPFYRPTIVKTKWMNGSEVCNVSNIETIFMNRGYVVDLSTYEYGNSHENKTSNVKVAYPTRGITYVGNVVDMREGTALSMYFNGIDTYSYIYTDIQFTHGGVSDSRQISIPTFSTSGWYEE